MIKRLTQWYRDFALMVLSGLILFILANVTAYFLIKWFPSPELSQEQAIRALWKKNLSYYHVPKVAYQNDRAFLRTIYPDYSDDEIWKIIHTPSLRAHPTLEFMETPTQSKFYNVGVENMRYTQRVTAENAQESINGAVWVFGGSTTFGDGIADHQTIPAFLNALDSSETYINFGVQAYHQSAEIEKLELLLKKGYTPKQVIFIDGLNDLVLMRGTPFHPTETPARPFNAYGYIANIERIKYPGKELILRRLPLVDLVFSLFIDAKKHPKNIDDLYGTYEDIYQPENLYHADPIFHYNQTVFAENSVDKVLENITFYQQKMIEYYRLNSAYLEKLASAFGFQYQVFYQPIGMTNLENPFIARPNDFSESEQYKFFLAMKESVQKAIANQQFKHFYDISDADAKAPKAYVDVLHYNPQLCKIIAQAILTQ